MFTRRKSQGIKRIFTHRLYYVRHEGFRETSENFWISNEAYDVS